MFRTILVGTDGSETAALAVSQAAELARSVDAKVHVVVAYKPGLTSGPGGGLGTPAAGAEDLGFTRVAAEEIAKRVGDQLRGEGIQCQAHSRAGAAADAILEVAREVSADLIVVGSKGMHRRVLGSVPNSVAHGAPCAVLIVKTA